MKFSHTSKLVYEAESRGGLTIYMYLTWIRKPLGAKKGFLTRYLIYLHDQLFYIHLPHVIDRCFVVVLWPRHRLIGRRTERFWNIMRDLVYTDHKHSTHNTIYLWVGITESATIPCYRLLFSSEDTSMFLALRKPKSSLNYKEVVFKSSGPYVSYEVYFIWTLQTIP